MVVVVSMGVFLYLYIMAFGGRNCDIHLDFAKQLQTLN